MRGKLFFGSLLLLASVPSLVLADRPVTITFLHNNDLHAHIEPVTIARKKYGGYARIATLIKQYRASDPNPVFLNAGDVFQGTLYFNVYEGLADLSILNYMGVQAMAVGNHEFDRGPLPLATFGKNATFPLISSNINLDAEPSLKDLVKKSTVIDVAGEKLGIVGATTDSLLTIAVTGPTVTLNPLLNSIQKEVDALTSKGISKIVLLSHCGMEEDLALAKQLRNVDLIIGGHSHTPLGTPDLPGWPKARGPFPTIAKDATGRDVPVFQTWEWGKVLGRFKVDFDEKGQIVRLYDNAPIVVDESIAEDPTVRSMVEALRRPIAELQDKAVGETKSEILRSGKDSTAAQLIADAMLLATEKQGVVAAFTNGGGVRSGIDAGVITYGEVISVTPFSNTLVILDITGEQLLAALKHGVTEGGTLLPSVGTSYRRGSGGVSEVVIAGKPIDPKATYNICFNSFTAGGGDGHEVLKGIAKRTDTGIVDIEAMIEFIKAKSPLDLKPENRVKG